jgi:DMSO/TMAO reductase YedYZ heme-binding membrane subunit
MTGCLVFAYDFEIDGLRLATRATARTSLFLFLAAFSATSSAELAPCGLTHWQRRNRRCLGVAFGVSHFLHLGSFVAVAVADSALFFSLAGVATFALAGLAYLLLAGMIATSFDRAAEWVGQTWWRRLHLAGSWYLWLTFLVAVVKRLPRDHLYWAMATLLIAAGVARGVCFARRRAGR